MRERGLKFDVGAALVGVERRSREGAWIEILRGFRERCGLLAVAPVRERGLKFAALMAISD